MVTIINKQWGFLLGIVGGCLGGCQIIAPSTSDSGTQQPPPQLSTTVSSDPSQSPDSPSEPLVPALRESAAPRTPQPANADAIEAGDSTAATPAATPEAESVVVLPGRTAGTTLTFPNVGSPPQINPEVKRWIRNRPVVDVTINETVQFEAILDPQASNTQITSVVAQLLELPITQQVVLGTPEQPKLAGQGTVSTIAIAEMRLSNLLVTIGDENLKISILGKDVLDNVQLLTTDQNVLLIPRDVPQ